MGLVEYYHCCWWKYLVLKFHLLTSLLKKKWGKCGLFCTGQSILYFAVMCSLYIHSYTVLLDVLYWKRIFHVNVSITWNAEKYLIAGLKEWPHNPSLIFSLPFFPVLWHIYNWMAFLSCVSTCTCANTRITFEQCISFIQKYSKCSNRKSLIRKKTRSRNGRKTSHLQGTSSTSARV